MDVAPHCGLIGTAVLGLVAVLSYLTAGMYFSAPRLADGTYETLMPYNFKWLPFTESLSIDMGILLDPISVMMLVVISTVSLLVHIYSFGYMKANAVSSATTPSCRSSPCPCSDW